MSLQIVVGFALAWCVVHLLRLAPRGRLYRLQGNAAPADFVRDVARTAIGASLLGAYLIGVGRPITLAGFLIAIGLLLFEIVRGFGARA